ncbi:MAG: flagellar motor switch/type III secretory pathway protein FliN [Lentisphaeria bacterium]|jgi:flagellar motor switch/type III secretory pathway protein FliN
MLQYKLVTTMMRENLEPEIIAAAVLADRAKVSPTPSPENGLATSRESIDLNYSDPTRKLRRLGINRFSDDEMTIANALGQYIFRANLPANHAFFGLTFVNDNDLDDFSPALVIEFMLNDVSAAVAIDHLLAKNIFAEILPVENLHDLPDLLLLAAAEAAIVDFISIGEQALNARIAVNKVIMNPTRIPKSWIFSAVNGQNALGHFAIHSNNEVNSILSNVLKNIDIDTDKSVSAKPKSRHWSDFPVPVIFEFAKIDLTKIDWDSLHVGDILVLEQLPSTVDLEITINVANNYTTQGILRDGSVKLDKNLELTMSRKPFLSRPKEKELGRYKGKELDGATGRQKRGSPLNALEVNLSFDVGTLNIDIKTLETMGKGYVFKLDHQLEKLVSIRSAGECVAIGELVEVGDSVGVRIVELGNGTSR